MDKEIIINEENSIVPKSQFNRVDFEQSSTILNYGQDVLDKMESIITKATQDIKQESLPAEDFRQRVDSLSGFSDKLDNLEEQRDNQNKLKNKITNFFMMITGHGTKETRLSYNEEYKRYIDNIDELIDDVNTMYESSKKDFMLMDGFIKSMKPYLDILEEVYQFGILDRDKFEKEVVLLEEQYSLNPIDADLKRESVLKRQRINAFNDKLYAIQKSKAALSELIIQWNMQQVTSMKKLSSYQSFLSLDKSILKLNGTALVGAKKQKEEVELLSYLMDGVNSALVEGPKELNEVIAGTNELTKDGNIRTETFMEIDQYLQTGVELLKQGAIEKQAFIEESSKQLEIISEHFKSFNLEIKEQVLLDGSYMSNQSTSKIKKYSKLPKNKR